MRGRLIRPVLAELYQFDTEITASDPDGSGALTSGLDPDFHTVVAVPDGTQTGKSARAEKTPIRIPCQVESQRVFALQQMPSGPSPSTQMVLVFHFLDLEELQLLDVETNEAMIRIGDRLDGLYDLNENLLQTFRNPPGLFATQVHPRFGLGGQRNLLLVTFEPRERAV